MTTPHTPCQGKNCGTTDGVSHSPECIAEHEAIVNAAAAADEQYAEDQAIVKAAGSHKDLLMQALPGLVGAIDQAFIGETGQKTAFILVAFIEGAAVHATNINPPEAATEAMKALVAGWDAMDGGAAGTPS